jgi:hypothetical protein
MLSAGNQFISDGCAAIHAGIVVFFAVGEDEEESFSDGHGASAFGAI